MALFLFYASNRVFVAAWNVAGKSPPSHLTLEDWLHASPPADIYVLGFQEIVPLNAGNVLGTEDNGGYGYHTPSPIPDQIVESDADLEGSTRQKASAFFHRWSFQSLSRRMIMDNDMLEMQQPRLDQRFSVCDRLMFGHRPSYNDLNYRWGSSDDENESPIATHYSPVGYSGTLPVEGTDGQ
ncbi:hypothetical protein Ancab_022329 [Ancistrocladus abbreviatus]